MLQRASANSECGFFTPQNAAAAANTDNSPAFADAKTQVANVLYAKLPTATKRRNLETEIQISSLLPKTRATLFCPGVLP